MLILCCEFLVVGLFASCSITAVAISVCEDFSLRANKFLECSKIQYGLLRACASRNDETGSME